MATDAAPTEVAAPRVVDRDVPRPAAPTRPAAAPPRPGPRRSVPDRGWGVPLAVLIVGMFMSVLDISIINVAIPTMQREFAATTEQIQWVENAYSLALGVVVPVSAWLAARFGPGRVYILSLLGFAAGSALCGLAWDLNSIVAFRVLQALPGGVLPVVSLTILYRMVPPYRIGAAMGMYGLGIIVAPAVGPTLGGYLVEYVDWRLIFFINVPVGILGTVAAVLLLPRFGPTPVGRFDLLGFLCVATGLVCLLLALTEGQQWGWTSYTIMILLTVGVLGLALFVVVELEVDAPLLNVRVFTHWPFTNSLLLVSVLSVGLFAVLFYIPLLLQQARGLGAFDTGLLLLPQALVMAVIMPAAGLLYDRIGPRWPAVIGLALVALGTYLLTDVNLESSTSHVVWVLVLRAVGMGLAMMPIMTGGLSSVPANEVDGASAFNNVVQRTSSALGLAGLTSLVTYSREQFALDRGLMVAPDTPMPVLAPGPTGEMAGMYAVYQQIQTLAFVDAMHSLFIVTAIITAAGIPLALMLRSGPSTPAAGGAVVAAH
ncbi:MAG: DHA2 family efflux MFS transporter permease subunit [Pseudonocardia sp.]|nr:DHA2 family efflux MFS transporter permease subunit [Pseudonocardia sp.]